MNWEKDQIYASEAETSARRNCQSLTDSHTLPNLDEWVSRIPGWLNLYLTQVLNIYGCFNRYMHGINKVEDCP